MAGPKKKPSRLESITKVAELVAYVATIVGVIYEILKG